MMKKVKKFKKFLLLAWVVWDFLMAMEKYLRRITVFKQFVKLQILDARF